MTADDIKYIEELCINAKKASKIAANLKTVEKNNILFKIAKKILDNKDYIISENKKDLKEAEATGIAPAMLDRLLLNEKRIDDIAKSV